MPLAELGDAAKAVIGNDVSALLYGEAKGYAPLRELLVEKTARLENMSITLENLIITNGAAQALGLLATALLDAGDRMLIDEASWGAEFFGGFDVERIPVRWDEDGPILSDIEKACRQGPIKLAYTIPTFQNPMGRTATTARRRALLELARHYGFLIAEDDAYYELRFAGQRVPSIYQLARGNGVVRVGTFSKILGAGTRLGWAMADPATIDTLTLHKYDLGASPFTCRIVAEYMQTRMFDHIEALQAAYLAKRDCLLGVLDSRLAGSPFIYSRPEGGFFSWLRLGGGISAQEVEAAMAAKGVDVWAGSWFRHDQREDGCVRISYSFADIDEIEAGAELLCEELLARV